MIITYKMLFKREINRNIKGFIVTCFICSFMAAYMVSMSSSFGKDIQQLLNVKFPKEFQLAFGMQGLDYSRANSFFAMCFSYLYLFISIYISTLFATIVSKEFSEKTAEYLFSLPSRRINIIASKLSAASVYSLLLVLLVFVAAWLSFKINIRVNYDIKPVILMTFAWLFGGITFGSIGFMLSSIFIKTRTIASISVGLVLFMYLLQVIISVNQHLDLLKYISPFDWFKGSEIDSTGQLSVKYCLIAVIVSATCFLTGIRRFNKMDVLI